MSTAYFPSVNTWHLTQAMFRDSIRELARDGVDGNEGIVLWLGQRDAGQAVISHIVCLRGPGITKRPDLLVLDAALLNDVTDTAIDLGVALVGQIHSHGRFYGTDLSRTDRLQGITVPSYLSIVAPDYGLRPATRLEDCGVHIYEPQRGYRRLGAPEAARRVHMSGGPATPIVIVGGQ